MSYEKMNKYDYGIDQYVNKANIKNNLRKYRTYKMLTQAELAKKLGFSVNHVRKIEVKNYYPMYQDRVKICNFFNLSQHQMFFIEEMLEEDR